MPAPTAPHRRLRATVLTVVVVHLAVLGHLTGGGMLPDVGLLLLAGALTWPVCWQLTHSPRGFPTILLTLIAAQPVLHVLLEFGGALFAGTAGSSAAVHDHGAAAVGDAAGSSPGTGLVAMTTFHAIAALISAVVLARGERVLTRVVDAGRQVAAALVPALLRRGVPMQRTARPVRRSTELPLPLSIAVPTRHGRRGPPALHGAH